MKTDTIKKLWNKSREIQNTIESITLKQSSAFSTEEEEQLLLQQADDFSKFIYDYFANSDDKNSDVTTDKIELPIDNTYKFTKLTCGYGFTIPPLVSRRSKNAERKKYINSVFEQLIVNNQDSIKRMETATVIIVACYTDLGTALDTDNEDIHGIINLINRYIMSTDDNPEFLNLFLTSQKCKQNKTKVYVIDKKDYCALFSNKE